MKKWKTTETKLIHKNNYFGLYHDKFIRHDGKEGDYFVIRKDHAVFVVPVSSDRKIHMVKQFRYPTQTWGWELPAGSTDGEDPLDAAKRELQEETGLVSEKVIYIDKINLSPGLSDNVTHIFVATELKQTDWNTQKDEGIIESNKFSLPEIKIMIEKGEIVDAPTIAVLARVFWVPFW